MNPLHSLSILIKKEFTEFMKEYKLLWLPIVFIGVGIMQPLTMKLLPEMIGQVDGIMLDPNAPVSSGNEIFAGVFGQLNQFGILIAAIILMGSIVKEKQAGILDILLSKPISTTNYLISKYVSNSLLVIISILIGALAGVYYTNIYYTPVNMELFLQAMLLYMLWFLFIVIIGVTASAIANTQLQAAGIAVAIPTLLSILGNYSNPIVNCIFPSMLSKNAVSLMMGLPLSDYWKINIFSTLIIIFGLCIMAILQMRYKRRG